MAPMLNLFARRHTASPVGPGRVDVTRPRPAGVDTLRRALSSAEARLHDAQVEAALTLAHAAESRDIEARGHLQAITDYGVEIAMAMGLPAIEVERYRHASPLHDIGKIGIPDAILKKPGRLTLDEYGVMQTHASLGARLFEGASSPILQAAADICRSHHERWDGSGYPNRLRGREIPLLARILAVADVFDALVTKRCYKPAWSIDDAWKEITETTAHQFDPDVIAAFERARPRIVRLAGLRAVPGGPQARLDDAARAAFSVVRPAASRARAAARLPQSLGAAAGPALAWSEQG